MPADLRVFVGKLREGEVDLDPEATRYLVRVHRLRPGDRFVAFDPRARVEATATLVEAGRQRARARLGPVRPGARFSPLQVTLIQALGKGDKPERVVRDATALGATALVVVESTRSVVRLGERGPERRARWESVALEAARQCGRGDLPRILGPVGLEAALGQAQGRRLVLQPQAASDLPTELAGWQPGEPLTLLIGPEGGLAADELQAARDHGFRPVRLGPFVLRTETAATAALGVLAAWTR